MGRAAKAIRNRDLPQRFSFFGLEHEPRLVDAHRQAIAARFAVEVGEIVRLCSKLRERERFKLFREALRLAYESALRRGEPSFAAGYSEGAHEGP